jgi:hypothetical protein
MTAAFRSQASVQVPPEWTRTATQPGLLGEHVYISSDGL